jgi:putative addiction module killer protein
VGDAVSEMRIHFGPGYRLYFIREDQTVIVLLCGGDKDSQPRDIQRAKRLALEWRQQ